METVAHHVLKVAPVAPDQHQLIPVNASKTNLKIIVYVRHVQYIQRVKQVPHHSVIAHRFLHVNLQAVYN